MQWEHMSQISVWLLIPPGQQQLIDIIDNETSGKLGTVGKYVKMRAYSLITVCLHCEI